ncbi:MAG: hypothetical protein ACPLZY_04245 [Candidatus Norongarragalinales archaeon]
MAEVAVLAGLGLNVALTAARARVKQKVVGKRVYPVGMLVVDASRSFTVGVAAPPPPPPPALPKAYFDRLWIRCKQLDGTFKLFNILAGETPSAVAGAGNLMFDYMDIRAMSDASGTLFIRVTDDAGVQIGYWEATGMEVRSTPVTFDMPNRPYGLKVEIGHL